MGEDFAFRVPVFGEKTISKSFRVVDDVDYGSFLINAFYFPKVNCFKYFVGDVEISLGDFDFFRSKYGLSEWERSLRVLNDWGFVFEDVSKTVGVSDSFVILLVWRVVLVVFIFLRVMAWFFVMVIIV